MSVVGPSTGCSSTWDCCEYGQETSYSLACTQSASGGAGGGGGAAGAGGGGDWLCECLLDDTVVGNFTSTGSECSVEAAETDCGWDIP